MPVGVTVNCLAVLTGGILGGWLGKIYSHKDDRENDGSAGTMFFLHRCFESYESRVSTSCDFGGAAGMLFWEIWLI